MNTNKPVVSLSEPTVARAPDTVRIFVRDCRVDLRIGIYENEMQKLQPVIVNVEIEAVLPHHYQDLSEKKLDRVIDYEPVYDFICEQLPALGHIYLLETAAEQIMNFCFRDIRVQKVRVRLEKTGIFPAAAGAGIEVSRSRSAADKA
jgi:dihydroneopterin aldolase